MRIDKALTTKIGDSAINLLLFVKQPGRQIPFARVGEQGDDPLALVFRLAAEAQGDGEGGAGGDADEQPLHLRGLPGDGARLLGGDGLDLIDYGVEDEFDEDEENNEITIYGAPTSFGEIQKHLEAEGCEVTGAEFTYIPNDLKDVTAEERETIDKMIEKLEEFDDVQTVYTNMKPEIPADAE